jgi:hypothetical protein
MSAELGSFFSSSLILSFDFGNFSEIRLIFRVKFSEKPWKRDIGVWHVFCFLV